MERTAIVYIAATDGRYGELRPWGRGRRSSRPSAFLDVKTPLAEWVRQIGKASPTW